MKRKLRTNQREAIKYARKVQHPALFMEMRLGKSLVTLRRILQYPRRNKVLIVCPYSAFYGWKKELRLEGNESIVELTGNREFRLTALKRPGLVPPVFYLASKEAHLVIPEIAHIDWDAVVLDENFIKDPRTDTSKFYVENFRSVPHRFILTGTPAPEGEVNYYQLVRWLDHHAWKENSYWEWRAAHFMAVKYEWITKTNADYKYISQVLAKYCFFQTRADVKMGGKKIYEQRTCQMPVELRKIYNKAEREYALECPGVDASTMWAPVVHIWLRRLCGGFVNTAFTSNFKIKELITLLETELKKQQVVIWCRFTREIGVVAYALKQRRSAFGIIHGAIKHKDRDERMEMFQEGRYQYLVAQPACFRYGVDLSAATTVIYYSSPDSFEMRQQSEDRVIDVVNNDSVLIIDLVASDTIEEDVIDSLIQKEGRQLRMRRAVDGILGRTRGTR